MPSLLDEVVNYFTQDVRRLLLLTLIVIGVRFAILGVGISVVIFLLLRVVNKITYLMGGFGCVSFVLAWGLFNVSPHILSEINYLLFINLIHQQHQILTQPFIWLANIPVGLILGTVFHWLNEPSNFLLKELKRISKGKRSNHQKFLSQKKMEKYFKTIKTAAVAGGSLLGINRMTGEQVVLKDSDANLHTLAIGTTGSGKTTLLTHMIESAVVRKLPLIYVDGKGDSELARRIGQLTKAHQVKYYLFSMVGESCRYNPLSSGGVTSKKDRIIELRQWSEDHYRKIAEGYLQTVFTVLSALSMRIDLYTLSHYLTAEKLYLLAREQHRQDLMPMIAGLENKEKDMVSLKAEIENLAMSEIGHLFDCAEGAVLTLEQALDEMAVVYFCLQPLAFPAYAETLGKVIINDIKALAASQLNKAEKPIIYTIFDEFSVFAGEQIIYLINQGRGAGIHAVLSTQSLSDIARKGGETLVGQVLNNCNNYIIQRQNNPEDAGTLAQLIGTQEIFQVTSQLVANQDKGGHGAVMQTREYIVHPDEIKRLKLGEAVFLNKQTFQVTHLGIIPAR